MWLAKCNAAAHHSLVPQDRAHGLEGFAPEDLRDAIHALALRGAPFRFYAAYAVESGELSREFRAIVGAEVPHREPAREDLLLQKGTPCV